MTTRIVDEQRGFYEKLFREYGHDPRALSWRDKSTQGERFARIALAFRHERGSFTVHEVGCGLGDLGEYLAVHHPQAVYSGSEISAAFVQACQSRFPPCRFFLRDITSCSVDDKYDFLTLSGTLHTRESAPPEAWKSFIINMLSTMYGMAHKGIAVNFLTTRCDPGKMSERLHYQDEKEILDFTVGSLSRFFELDASGPLYEYTLRIFRPEYVESMYPGAEFVRYFQRKSSP